MASILLVTKNPRSLGWATEPGSQQISSSNLSGRQKIADPQKKPFEDGAPEVVHISFVQVHMVAHSPDIGTNGRVADQIRALSIQSIERNHLIRPRVVVVERAATEQIASLHVFPKKWKEHVTQMPTGHG